MKREIWIGSFVLKYFGIVITFVALFSNCTKDENITTPPPIPTPEWKTVFFDDFSRTNTINGDLGSNWWVFDTTNGSIMQITNNEVRSVQGTGPCPYALYFQEVNNSTFRISVKVKTDSITDATIILFARVDSSLSDGYFVGYDDFFFMSGALSPNAIYVDDFKIEILE